MLNEFTLFGNIDRVQAAIERLCVSWRFLEQHPDFAESHYWKDACSMYDWWANNRRMQDNRQMELEYNGGTGGMGNEP